MVVGACTLSAPASRLGALAHMGLIGVFAAFLLGWRVLAVHCVFATVAIFGLMGWNARLGEATWFDQYVYSAPALSSVVLLPIITQVVIEGGRRSPEGNIACCASRSAHRVIEPSWCTGGAGLPAVRAAGDPNCRGGAR